MSRMCWVIDTPGGEMRVEVAMTKLMHAVAAFDDRDERRAYLMRDVAGEMTT